MTVCHECRDIGLHVCKPRYCEATGHRHLGGGGMPHQRRHQRVHDGGCNCRRRVRFAGTSSLRHRQGAQHDARSLRHLDVVGVVRQRRCHCKPHGRVACQCRAARL